MLSYSDRQRLLDKIPQNSNTWIQVFEFKFLAINPPGFAQAHLSKTQSYWFSLCLN
jgi:hypothetical protein